MEEFLGLIVSVGFVLAVAISYIENKSVLWAIVHGLLNWIYVAYHSISGGSLCF